MHWLRHDVLAFAGPDLATRRELFDFIAAELAAREHEDPRRIRPVRVALQNQRDQPLAFAGVLDAKLADVARVLAVPEPLVRDALMLHRVPTTSPAYWQGWNRLRAQTGARFHALFAAVSGVMADTSRSSSLVENLNSPLRTYASVTRGGWPPPHRTSFPLQSGPHRPALSHARVTRFRQILNHAAGHLEAPLACFRSGPPCWTDASAIQQSSSRRSAPGF